MLSHPLTAADAAQIVMLKAWLLKKFPAPPQVTTPQRLGGYLDWLLAERVNTRRP